MHTLKLALFILLGMSFSLLGFPMRRESPQNHEAHAEQAERMYHADFSSPREGATIPEESSPTVAGVAENGDDEAQQEEEALEEEDEEFEIKERLSEMITQLEKAQKTQEITDQGLRIFVKHYYFDYLDKYRSIENEFRREIKKQEGGYSSNNNKDQENFIFCIELCLKQPFAKGLEALDQSEWRSVNWKEHWCLGFDFFNFLDDIRYKRGLMKKVLEARIASHDKLAECWKRFCLGNRIKKETNLYNYSLDNISDDLDYVDAKLEEAKILGYQSQIDHWEALKEKLHSYAASSEKKSLPLFKGVFFDNSYVCLINESQRAERDFINLVEIRKRNQQLATNYLKRAEQAKESQCHELALLWEGAAATVGLREVNHFLLAACSYSKSLTADPKIAVIWKNAASFFQEAALKNGEEAKEIGRQANECLALADCATEYLQEALLYKKKKEKAIDEYQRKNLDPAELAGLYDQGISYFEEAVEKVHQATSNLKKVVEGMKKAVFRDRYSNDAITDNTTYFTKDMNKIFGWDIKDDSSRFKYFKHMPGCWEQVERGISFVSGLFKHEFYDLATRLDQKNSDFKAAIKSYIQAARRKAMASWEWHLLQEGREDHTQSQAYYERRRALEEQDTFQSRCKSFLEQIINYSQKIQDPNSADFLPLYWQGREAAVKAVEAHLDIFPRDPNTNYHEGPQKNPSLDDARDFSEAVESAEKSLEKKEEGNDREATLLSEVKDLLLQKIKLRAEKPASVNGRSDFGSEAIQLFDESKEAYKKGITDVERENDFKILGEQMRQVAEYFVKTVHAEKKEVQDLCLLLAKTAQDTLKKRYTSYNSGINLISISEKDQQEIDKNKIIQNQVERLLELKSDPRGVGSFAAEWAEIAGEMQTALTANNGKKEYFERKKDQLTNYAIRLLEVKLEGRNDIIDAWNKVIEEGKKALTLSNQKQRKKAHAETERLAQIAKNLEKKPAARSSATAAAAEK